MAEKKLELLEEVKPPPKNFESDIVDEPQITITKKVLIRSRNTALMESFI